MSILHPVAVGTQHAFGRYSRFEPFKSSYDASVASTGRSSLFLPRALVRLGLNVSCRDTQHDRQHNVPPPHVLPLLPRLCGRVLPTNIRSTPFSRPRRGSPRCTRARPSRTSPNCWKASTSPSLPTVQQASSALRLDEMNGNRRREPRRQRSR